jgi:hypothetical protein
MSDERKVLRPGSATFYLPERPAPARETAETIPEDWIKAFDQMPSHVAQYLHDHDPVFARRVDLLLARRKNNGY